MDNDTKNGIRERFWDKVDIGELDECWNWKAAIQSSGYGSFGISAGKTELAHRVAFELEIREIPDGFLVCHTCDNPKCVNPQHLFLCTHQDNSDDKVKKGREAKWERNGRSKLRMEDVLLMRMLYEEEEKTIKDIASVYGIHYNTARKAIHGNTWKDLPLAE